ncbi:MAG: dihydropteroate synthase [Bacteroidota bacterium]
MHSGIFPKIMGIINVTPDSFSDGGFFFEREKAIEHGLQLIEEGADMIDIGGESTRPGSLPVSEEEELNRVIPVITGILKHYPDATISIDTTKPKVAKESIKNGAKIINNVFGISKNDELCEIASRYNATLILMHIQGSPKIMQENPVYNNVVEDVFNELNQAIKHARSKGVKNIIGDVGIGFGKTLEHNLELLKNHQTFTKLGVPLLLGISRKSFIGKVLGIEASEERDIATALYHSLLLKAKADIIRVHNVKLISMLMQINNSINN